MIKAAVFYNPVKCETNIAIPVNDGENDTYKYYYIEEKKDNIRWMYKEDFEEMFEIYFDDDFICFR